MSRRNRHRPRQFRLWLQCRKLDRELLHQPQPPENIRFLMADGSEIPVDAAFDKYDERGVAMWAITSPMPAGRVVGIEIGMLPARTAVGFRKLA